MTPRTRTGATIGPPVALLELAADRSPAPTAFFDHEGTLLWANRAWRDWTGAATDGAAPVALPDLLAHHDHAEGGARGGSATRGDSNGCGSRPSRRVLRPAGLEPVVAEVHETADGVAVLTLGTCTDDDPTRTPWRATGTAGTEELDDWVTGARSAGATRYAALSAHLLPSADHGGPDREPHPLDEQGLRRLQGLLRPGDLVSAPADGGFLVLCVIERPDDALAVAERIRREISPERRWPAWDVVIGIAHGPTSTAATAVVAGATEAKAHALRHGHPVQVARGL